MQGYGGWVAQCYPSSVAVATLERSVGVRARALVNTKNECFFATYGEVHYALQTLLQIAGFTQSGAWVDRASVGYITFGEVPERDVYVERRTRKVRWTRINLVNLHEDGVYRKFHFFSPYVDGGLGVSNSPLDSVKTSTPEEAWAEYYEETYFHIEEQLTGRPR